MFTQVLLQAAANTPGGFDFSTIGMFVLLIVIFYFFMIRPQTKKQKEIKKFREGLKNGDSVITAGGIYGKIRDIQDNCMLLEVSDGVKIKVDKNMIYPNASDAGTSVQENK
ncbi:MAG: preprotein translocase subunit YajC [Muribaculaceae bacterium]|nr:preprotein translocase subunit YajC [Muribaculaceae bacterium]